MALKALTRDRAAFCSHCGGPVEPSATSCRSCRQPLDGTVNAQRCPACGALSDDVAQTCGKCGQALRPGGSPQEEIEERLQTSLDSMNGVLQDQRARLDDLERRLEKTKARLDAIKDSTKDVEVKERARLNVWMAQAEDERSAILRVAEGWMEVSEAFAAVRGRLRELEGQKGATTAPRGPSPEADRIAPVHGTPEAREKNLKQWWEAQKGIKEELIQLANSPQGGAAGVPSEGTPGGEVVNPDREALFEVLTEIRKVLDELPPAIQKKLRKSGRLEELQSLLGGQTK